MTALGREIAGLIAAEGPISLRRYMALCLGHPVHGYYITRDPLGRAGDFTTAPEISQMFGELLGLWAASTWAAMGRPGVLRLIELGPGRGTLMADALRAARALPGFLPSLTVHMVETSPALRKAQQGALAGCGAPVFWHMRAEEVPAGPAIVLANEFFDALPIRQVAYADGGWRERMVGLSPEGALTYGLSAAAYPLVLPGREGEVREICPEGAAIMAALARRLAADGGALLAIDYGYAQSAAGDTFQALRGHAFADPLEAPGAADLTAHVDFAALGRAATAAGAVVHPLLTQRALLARLGLAERASALVAAQPGQADEVGTAFDRLAGLGAGQMGGLFKALCVTGGAAFSREFAPPGFDSPDPSVPNWRA